MTAPHGLAESQARDKGPSTAPEASPRVRLAYLDGLRALAASYVVLFHAVPGFCGQGLSGPWRLLRRLLAFGHEAVAIFIVLSGYCLMLPVVRARPELLEVSFSRFLRRRALRILPPYFAALGASVAALACFPVLRTGGTGTIWDSSLPGLELGPLLSHALLVHNWSPEWGYQINGPLWSVASEWQLYFFFPLLFLPVWRRFGMLAVFVVALVVGYAPLAFARAPSMVASPWYLALFVLGMQAAAIGFSTRGSAPRLRGAAWSSWTALLWLACLMFSMGAASVWFSLKPVTDLLVGAATAALLVHLTNRAHHENRGQLLRILESRPLIVIGNFSYSLYLTHLPVVALCYFLLRSWALSSSTLALAMLAICIPSSLAVASIFYLIVERPSLRLRG